MCPSYGQIPPLNPSRKIKEETTNDIDSVIRRVPFPSLLRDVEGNETKSNKGDAGRDEYHRAGDTAEQETPRSPRNERGTPQNEYGTMEYSPGATAPSNGKLYKMRGVFLWRTEK